MDRLLRILGDIRPDVDFEHETGLIDGGILDSLNILEIVGEISDVFDVDITPAEIVPSNFNSAAAMLDMINRLK